MKNEIRNSASSRMRGLARRLAHPASATAALCIAGLLAVMPLLAGGVSQLSAGLAAMPDQLTISVAEAGTLQRAQADATQRPKTVAAERGDRVFHPATRAARIAAQPRGPRFADFDSERFATDEAHQAPQTYAWIAGDSATVSLVGLDQRFALASASAALDVASPVLETAAADAEALPGIPLPEQRPRIASAADGGSAAAAAVAAVVPAPEPSGTGNSTPRTALAYASPEPSVEEEEEKSGGIFGRLFGKRNQAFLPDRGSKVAVYDIGSATLYMPNGEKLEAHSGLAHMKDNPRYVAEKNKGPTPPNLYNLKMRESLFHGVEAIRLLPADGKKKYNRDGLLAHTYMHVRGGGLDDSQSNGCMAVKEYDKFLNAFKRGQVKHLIVVPHLKEVPTYMAAL